MLTKTMKLVSIAALLAAVTLWSYAPMFDLPLRFVLGRLTLAAELGAVVVFAGSLVALKTHPMLSIPSITDRTPGSRSL